jgi:hypothetical protein
MSEFLKPTVIVQTALGVLRRELVLPSLVWRDAAGDFAGALNDTISIRLPAYAKARTRALRSGDARTRDNLAEQKVDVTLTTDVYKDIKISDEELTLDIRNFGLQVLNPVMAGVAESLEDQLISTIEGATYAKSIAFTIGTDDAWKDLILPARELLNKARVPQAGRVLAVGSAIETEMLGTDLFVKANESGGTSALEDAVIGRKAGFTIVSVPGLDPDEAYAFHQTAYVMSNRAPVVPAGAPFGASTSFDGFAMRIVRVLESSSIEDILALDSWMGANVTHDPGYFDSDGRFTPTDADAGLAVAIANTSAAADDKIDTAAAHGFVAGDRVVFTALTGGAGLVTNQEYFVIAANLAASTFQVSETLGGAAVDFTTDITAGSVQKNANGLVVRAVKITAS